MPTAAPQMADSALFNPIVILPIITYKKRSPYIPEIFFLGTCANHITDVRNFFKGAHVTMNARTEEEVDSQIIIDRVSKSTGSAYSFKERSEHEHAGPVVCTIILNPNLKIHKAY